MINIKKVTGKAKWKRNPKCEYMMSKTIQEVVESDDFENEGNMFINELDLATIDMALGYNFNSKIG